MFTSGRRFCTAALASLALLAAGAAQVQAQPRLAYPIGVPAYAPPIINTNPYVAPGLTLQQYAYNVATMSRAYSTIPPYMLGYNPYPSAVTGQMPLYNPVSPYPYNPVLQTGGYNPYATNPYLSTNPGAMSGPTLSTTPGYDTSLSTNPYTNPYSSYPGYQQSPLQGVADLTNATAQYYVTIQRAKLQEDVTRSRLETRRRILEEAEREKKMIPTQEELRQKDYVSDLNRAKNDPPLTDVLSGKSLNVLLKHLVSQQTKGFRGLASIPLDDIDLNQINVSGPDDTGNIGLVKNLKQGDKLAWPTVLLGETYKEAREKLDSRLPNAVGLLRTQKPVPDGDIRDLEESVAKMVETLNGNIGDLSPTQYITGKRYLNMLQDALTAMKSANAINYFNGTWVPKGKNVAELVDSMKKLGLKFTPATPGNDATYRVVHQLLLAYDATMTQVAASK
jgi:hypothetical protein